MKILRKLLKRLPKKYVNILKKIYYKKKINDGTFKSEELEFELISQFIRYGDSAIDIGANVGHYTLRLSELVGKEGRVIAFEPIPDTFDILSSNVAHSEKYNVTLINGAISTEIMEAKFTIPGGNLYQSHMDSAGEIGVMAFPLTSFLPKDWNLVFIKIDAEGCDESIIRSTIGVINRYRPIVMSEISQEIAEKLAESMQDYTVLGLKSSHNRFIVPVEKEYLIKL